MISPLGSRLTMPLSYRGDGFSASRRSRGDDLVRDPETVVRAYCDRMGIPFVGEALAWEAGDRAEWGPTRRWHIDAGVSRGFHRSSNDYAVSVDDDPVLGRYLRHHRPFYEELRAHRVAV